MTDVDCERYRTGAGTGILCCFGRWGADCLGGQQRYIVRADVRPYPAEPVRFSRPRRVVRLDGWSGPSIRSVSGSSAASRSRTQRMTAERRSSPRGELACDPGPGLG